MTREIMNGGRADGSDGIGYLSVTVRTAGGALPVPGAAITVRAVGGDVMAVVFSDGGGITVRIALPAPPVSNSKQPDSGTPYSFYNIDTEKTGFFGVRNLRVPIYSGVTAIQPIDLIPLPENNAGNAPPEDLIEFGQDKTPDL